MAISAWLVYQSGDSKSRSEALRYYGLQLSLNLLWSVLFFGAKSPLLGFITIVLLLLSIIRYMMSARNVSKAATWIFVPYLLWVGFATMLNLAILILN